MKKYAFLVAFLSIFLLGGCDMFRALTGRTSPEEAATKERLQAGAQMVDSLKAARAEMDEEFELADSIRVYNADVDFIDNNAGDLYAGVVKGNYYIVVGSFAVESNFENQVRTVLDAGYLPSAFRLKNGMHCVAVSPVKKSRDAEYALLLVLHERFAPVDTYIMYVK